MKKILLFTIIALSFFGAKAQNPLVGKPSLKLVFDVAQTKKWEFTVDTNNLLTINGTGGTPGIRLSDYNAARILYTDADGDLLQITDGTTGQALTTNGAGVYSFSDVSSVSFGTDNQVPFTNSGGTDFDYSSNFTFNGTRAFITNDGLGTLNAGDPVDPSDGIILRNTATPLIGDGYDQRSPFITFIGKGGNSPVYNMAARMGVEYAGSGTQGRFVIQSWSDSFSWGSINSFELNPQAGTLFVPGYNYISTGAMSDATTREHIRIGDDTSPHFATFSYRKEASADNGYLAIAGKSGGDALRIYGDGSVGTSGTWTVTLYDAITGGNASATTVTGYYTQVGKMVTCWFPALNNISTAGMTGGNTLYVSLPTTSSANASGMTGSVTTDQINFGAGYTQIKVQIPSASAARVLFPQLGDGLPDINTTVADITTGTSDITGFTLIYQSN